MASVGELFKAGLLPSGLLVGLYLLYILGIAILRPSAVPAMPPEEVAAFRQQGMFLRIVKAFLLPMVLIVAVLGSIFSGIASPTEAAGVGAFGAILLTILEGRFSWAVLRDVNRETTHLTAMVFFILVGATTFSLVFRELEGDVYLVNLIQDANLSPMAFLLLVMAVVFVAGFFIDFIEIIFIIVPVAAPIFIQLDVNLVWVGILLALNLQTSFLSPPFGFSLFYLKGVAPPSITTSQLYRGIVPFVIIQLVVLGIYMAFPALILD
jgi:tripartite ATP-independent transporter DctM subunit